tara:strand:- start:621 stop:1283 length:663 start_codon:yes stop_codon:yes gene_type:complete
MIEDVYKKRKHILSFDETIIPDKNLINSLLKKTWELTPSKNQFMSYTVHVVGPEHKSYKKSIYDICTMNESDANTNNKIIDKPRLNENLLCLLNAPYTLIFTNRYEDKPNKEQSYLISRGVYYEAADKDNFEKNILTNAIEVGMFSKILTGLCLENNLDVTYTKCFSTNYKNWEKTMPFIKTSPIMIMSIGKGKVAKKPKTYNREVTDLRPEFESIVKWI